MPDDPLEQLQADGGMLGQGFSGFGFGGNASSAFGLLVMRDVSTSPYKVPAYAGLALHSWREDLRLKTMLLVNNSRVSCLNTTPREAQWL